MIGFVIIIAVLLSFAWITNEINTFPENKDDDIDDPTTSVWHDENN